MTHLIQLRHLLSIVALACAPAAPPARDTDPAADAAARAAIATTMQRYKVHARAVNADSVAASFT